MIFQTISGSTYELDLEVKKIRRMEGIDNPTPRQGVDGEWKTFEKCSEIIVGMPLLVIWEGVRSTLTSIVAMCYMDTPASISN